MDVFPAEDVDLLTFFLYSISQSSSQHTVPVYSKVFYRGSFIVNMLTVKLGSWHGISSLSLIWAWKCVIDFN